MNTQNNAPPPNSPAFTATALPALNVRKIRSPLGPRGQSIAASTPTLSYRQPSASLSSLFASTSSFKTLYPRLPSEVGLSAQPSINGASTSALPTSSGHLDHDSAPSAIVMEAFAPHIAIYASEDTEELVKSKGFPGGLLQLLRPYGDTVHGKVTVRDSTGLSRPWDGFSVRFVALGDGLGDPQDAIRRSQDLQATTTTSEKVSLEALRSGVSSAIRTGGDVGQIEELIERHLNFAQDTISSQSESLWNHKANRRLNASSRSPFFALYLRRLLSGMPLSPHETFTHPVCCVIAISSRNSSPIETLRQLFHDTNRGDRRLPSWVNNEYLRYYLLIHDEDRDDFAKSSLLFDQMRRHFGLQCHLLRLKSSQCMPTDDDSRHASTTKWLSAAEELAEISATESSDDIEDRTPCLFESDHTALRSFVRDMVTQSVIPSMERNVASWNDQVASRRRGISGRFMSLSKKWAGFGTSSRIGSGGNLAGGSSGSNSNYDALQGFYRPDTPEALMRKLADYAFMLRDWRFAYGVYDLLRSDFNNDKAWKYHAGVNEMAAISALLSPGAAFLKARADNVDTMLETACYSYITRCSLPYEALRCLCLGIELFPSGGGFGPEIAANWATRVLELKLSRSIGNALFIEKVAECYGARTKYSGPTPWKMRRRKSAFWNILAAEAWLKLGKHLQAELCLEDAIETYGRMSNIYNFLKFDEAQAFIGQLRHELRVQVAAAQGVEPDEADPKDGETLLIQEESETLDRRSHRKSLIGINGAPFAGYDGGALNPAHATHSAHSLRDDSFQ